MVYSNQSLLKKVSKDTKLESVILEEDILQLHFKELHTNEELRFLEALTFTFCQLDGVEGIELFLNNEKLNQLPQGNILFNEPLTKALGINNFELGSERLYDTDSLVVYYAKTINKEEFYVPMTKRISSQSNLDDQLNSIVSEVSVSSFRCFRSGCAVCGFRRHGHHAGGGPGGEEICYCGQCGR